MPLASGPVSVPDAPPPTAVGAMKGVLAAAEVARRAAHRECHPVQAGEIGERRAGTVGDAEPDGHGSARRARGAQDLTLEAGERVDRSGTVCAPGIVMSNSWPVGAWQMVQNASGWGPTRSPCA